MKDQREDIDEIEIDLREIFYVLRKRILIIILAGILGAGIAAAYSFFLAKPVYEATSKLYILTQSTSITSLADIQIGSSLAMDYMELIQSRPVVNQVKRNLNLDISNKEIVEDMMTIENPADTRIIEISIRSDDPQQAADMANEFSDVAKRQISRIMETDEPTVVETAVVTSRPVKPEKAKNILIGLAIGLFLSALTVIVLHVLNDNIRNQDDVERYLGMNTLAAIPYAGNRKKDKKIEKKSEKKARKKGGRD